MAKKSIDRFSHNISPVKDFLASFGKQGYTSSKKPKDMNSIQKTNGIVKSNRPIVPHNAIAVYDDTERFKFGFGIASQSGSKIYKISFDAASGALFWRCSCPGCCRFGQCKHLDACGLRGWKDRKPQIEFAKKHGLI